MISDSDRSTPTLWARFRFSVVGALLSSPPEVLSELRLLSSADFAATALLTMVLSGDGRLLELLRHPDLVPLGTRIRTRLNTEAASREELSELLRHALAKAGNASLMTTELLDTLVDHAAGNYRLLMTLGGELLAYGMTREVAQLDEQCYLELFQPHPAPVHAKEESEALNMVRPPDPPLPVVRVGQIPTQEPPQRWLVEQLRGASSVGLIGGAPKCSKTWLGLDLVLSVATGTACWASKMSVWARPSSRWNAPANSAAHPPVGNAPTDDQPIGKPVDFYAPRRGKTDLLRLAEIDLTRGPNHLFFALVGKNEKSTGKGFDLVEIHCQLAENGKGGSSAAAPLP